MHYLTWYSEWPLEISADYRFELNEKGHEPSWTKNISDMARASSARTHHYVPNNEGSFGFPIEKSYSLKSQWILAWLSKPISRYSPFQDWLRSIWKYLNSTEHVKDIKALKHSPSFSLPLNVSVALFPNLKPLPIFLI